MMVPNMVMKFHNVDIFYKMYYIFDLLSALACHVVSVKTYCTTHSHLICSCARDTFLPPGLTISHEYSSWSSPNRSLIVRDDDVPSPSIVIRTFSLLYNSRGPLNLKMIDRIKSHCYRERLWEKKVSCAQGCMHDCLYDVACEFMIGKDQSSLPANCEGAWFKNGHRTSTLLINNEQGQTICYIKHQQTSSNCVLIHICHIIFTCYFTCLDHRPYWKVVYNTTFLNCGIGPLMVTATHLQTRGNLLQRYW